MVNYKLLIDDVLYEKKLSYGQAAIIIGFPKSTLYKICKGKREPKLSELIQIATALKVDAQELWEVIT